jgi:branched-subunit amino acid transport protein
MIFGAAAVTLAMRLSFLGTVKPHALPPRVREALRFAPPAVRAAIVLPHVLIRAEALAVSYDNPRLLAAVVAIGVAWASRSVVWTIVAGMVALWIAQWALG